MQISPAHIQSVCVEVFSYIFPASGRAEDYLEERLKKISCFLFQIQ